MRLRSLEIQGFKSFPDKTTLTFGGGITAVVGPNGSGKSNISDAVRWVLGEQSTKNLRGSKMEDVIFGGTQSRKAVGYAAVQLTIDNSDGTLPEQGGTVTISRRLYRSGESEYRLNGVAVRLRDIHELLMDTGLGRDGYSIIGQGRISEIVSAKSGSRREIFEEAAGISKFRFRKEESEKKLAHAQENLLRLRDILSELEERVGPLKEQSEKARVFLRLSEEKKTLDISLWMVGQEQIKAQLQAQEDKLYICKNEYEQLEREGAELEEKIAAAYAAIQELHVKIDTRRAEIKEIEEQLAKGESDVAVLQNDIHHNEISIRRLEGEAEQAGLDAGELLRQAADKEAELLTARQELSQMEQKLEAASERMEEQKVQIARLDEEIRELGVRQRSVEEAITAEKLARAASDSARTESAARMDALKASSGEHGAALGELERSIAECRRQLEEEQARAEGLRNGQKGYALKRQGREEKLGKLQARLGELSSAADARLQRARLLEDLEAGMEGFAGSVKYILGEAKKGSLRGVLGPVSSLIGVESRYALAVETALGASLQHIVVQDEQAAKDGIRLLKDAKAGRATFLPLSAVRGKRMDTAQIARQEGFIGLAAGLVRFEDKYAGVMDQLLGRTAVVEDIDCGTRIAKSTGYTVRIVTLDGQVINAGGSFTGGSSAKGAGVLGRRSEIERLKAEAEGLKAQAAELEPERRALQEELSALDAYIAGAEAELRTAQEEQVRLSSALEHMEKNREGMLRNQALAQRELEALSARLRELEGGGVSSDRLLRELEEQLAAHTGQLASAASRREMLEVGAETAAQLLSEQRMAQLSAQKDIELLEGEIERLRQSAEGAGENVQRLREERRALVERNESIGAEIRSLTEKKALLAGQVEGSEEEIAQLTARRTELEGNTTSLRRRERELAGSRENVSKELARLEERRITLQGEADALVSRLWDEYELTRSQAAQIAQPLEDADKAQRRLSQLRSQIKGLGSVNVAAIEEYAQVSERYEFLSAQVTDVERSRDQLESLIYDLTQEMRTLFSENFRQIAAHFSRIFVQLFGGGRAELTLTDEEDVLQSGVEIFVQPPGKLIKSLSLLSGGEQAFVAIAIYFAILKVRPAPFCLLDEIEAALDDVNVVKFAGYLRQMSDKTQFIAITHRRGTMEEADVLYGVTMQEEGVSKLLELSVSEMESKLGKIS